MPIPFTCPHCGHATTVDDQFAGQSGRCAACGQTITVPSAGGTPADFGTPAAPRPMSQQYPGGPRPQKSSSTAVILIVVILVCIVPCTGILIALLLPAVQSAREASRRMQCTSNLKLLGLSVHMHHDEHSQMPPARGECKDRENSTSEWSWRVQLLPYMEEASLADQFHYDEPWDSEHNLSVAEYMPSLFQCPSDTPDYKDVNGHLIPVTSYVMITGEFVEDPGTGRPHGYPTGQTDGRTISFGAISDGTSNTILIVEVCGDNRPAWTEPVDITVEDLVRGINPDHDTWGEMSIGSYHPNGCNVGMCDGSVHFISEDIESETLWNLIQINDGAPVSEY